tara:strand:- start:819 stop:1322 length:504 start_codon:yes stop_codon:yes gene_type:complete
MGLVQVATNTVTSAVASITLTGINSDDVYLVAMNNILPDTDNGQIRLRVTTSGTADSDSEYDRAYLVPRTAASFAEVSSTNQTYWNYNQLGTAGNEQGNVIMYLYNFNNSSEFSFMSIESAERTSAGELQSVMGGGVHTVNETNNGINIFVDSGNIASGTFTLYKVV